jgi:predicted aldo/keto reductase-like oxidoreductase
MLFFIDTEDDYRKVFDGGIADYAQRLKRDGYIGHIGFSFQNP